MLSNTTVTEISSRLKTLTLSAVLVWTNVKGCYTASYGGDTYKFSDSSCFYINDQIVHLMYDCPELKAFHHWLTEYLVGDMVLNKLDDAVYAVELLDLLDELIFEMAVEEFLTEVLLGL